MIRHGCQERAGIRSSQVRFGQLKGDFAKPGRLDAATLAQMKPFSFTTISIPSTPCKHGSAIDEAPQNP